jgi:hypothetical protein
MTDAERRADEVHDRARGMRVIGLRDQLDAVMRTMDDHARKV